MTRPMHLEKTAVPHIEVGRHLGELTRNQRLTVAVDKKNCTQLRQCGHDPLEPLVQTRLIVANGLVRHIAHDLVDFGDRAFYRLEHFERVLVQNIERSFDALIGDGVFVSVGEPGRPGEQHGGQHHRRNHHELQQANG